MADASSTVPEVYAIRSNRTVLNDTLSQVVDLSWLGTELYQADFVTTERKNNILTDAHGIPYKVCMFLDAVETQVRNDPTKCEAFIEILSKQPALNNTVERLEASRRAAVALGRREELSNHSNAPRNNEVVLCLHFPLGRWLAIAPRFCEVHVCWWKVLSAAFLLFMLMLVLAVAAVVLQREHFCSCIPCNSQNFMSHANNDSKPPFTSEKAYKSGKRYKSDKDQDRLLKLLQWFKSYIREGEIDKADQFIEQNISSFLASKNVSLDNRELFGALLVFFMKHSKIQQVIQTEDKLLGYFDDMAMTTMHDRCMFTSLSAYEYSLQNYSRAAELSQLVSDTLIKFKSSDHVYSTLGYWYIAIFSQFTMGRAMVASGREEEGYGHINEAATLAFALADNYLVGSRSACGASLVSVICEYVPVSIQHGRCISHIFHQIYMGLLTLVNQTQSYSLVPDSQIVYTCACGESDPYGASIDPLKWDTSAVVPTTVHVLYHSYWYLSMVDVIIPLFPANVKFLIKAYCHTLVFSIIFLCFLLFYFLGTAVFTLAVYHLVRKPCSYVGHYGCFCCVKYICKRIFWVAFTYPFVLWKTILLISLQLYIFYCVYYISHLEEHRKNRKRYMVYKDSSENGVPVLLFIAMGGVVSHILFFLCKRTWFKLSYFVVPLVTNSLLWHFSCKIMHQTFVQLFRFLIIITGQKFLYTVWLYMVFVGIAAMCYCEAAYALLSGAAMKIDVVMGMCVALLPFLRRYVFPIIGTVMKICFVF